MIIVSGWFVRLFTMRFASAITLWPFIILRDKKLKTDSFLMNHERIHLRQQLELLVIGFYIIYLTEFFIRLLINWNPYIAYRSISFEQEAYEYDKEMDYLMRRDYLASFKKRYFRKQF